MREKSWFFLGDHLVVVARQVLVSWTLWNRVSHRQRLVVWIEVFSSKRGHSKQKHWSHKTQCNRVEQVWSCVGVESEPLRVSMGKKAREPRISRVEKQGQPLLAGQHTRIGCLKYNGAFGSAAAILMGRFLVVLFSKSSIG